MIREEKKKKRKKEKEERKNGKRKNGRMERKERKEKRHYLPLLGENVLSEEGEVGFVGGEGEHDEVGVEAVHAVRLIQRPVLPLGLAVPDVLHDLVLALSWHVVP